MNVSMQTCSAIDLPSSIKRLAPATDVAALCKEAIQVERFREQRYPEEHEKKGFQQTKLPPFPYFVTIFTGPREQQMFSLSFSNFVMHFFKCIPLQSGTRLAKAKAICIS